MEVTCRRCGAKWEPTPWYKRVIQDNAYGPEDISCDDCDDKPSYACQIAEFERVCWE